MSRLSNTSRLMSGQGSSARAGRLEKAIAAAATSVRRSLPGFTCTCILIPPSVRFRLFPFEIGKRCRNVTRMILREQQPRIFFGQSGRRHRLLDGLALLYQTTYVVADPAEVALPGRHSRGPGHGRGAVARHDT